MAISFSAHPVSAFAEKLRILTVLLILFAAAGVQAAEAIRIGVTLGLTGRYAELALMQERGYRLWESNVNSKGGFLGRPVKVLIVDDESNPQTGRKLYEKFIKEEHVDLVFGPYSSAITLAVSPVVDRFDYPMLAAGAASDKIWQQGYTNVFGMSTPASRYALGMLNLALLHNLRTIGIVFADDAFSTTVGEGSKRWAPKLGLKVVLYEKFKKGTRDLTELAKKLRESKASLVLVGGFFNESIDVRRALKKIGWYPKAYFATVGPTLPKYYETLGDDAELTFASSTWEPHEAIDFPGSKAFVAAFRERYNATPSYHAARSYAAGQILEAAVRKANSLDREKIKQALYKLDMYSVLGRYAVDHTGMQVKRFPLTIQWQKKRKEIVWPEEVRSAEPIFR
jgi:branched-chain amino acid transport system substrate-binding protein